MQETAQGIYYMVSDANRQIRLENRPVIADWKPGVLVVLEIEG